MRACVRACVCACVGACQQGELALLQQWLKEARGERDQVDRLGHALLFSVIHFVWKKINR